MKKVINLIRIDGQTRKSVEYRVRDLVIAYATNSDGKRKASELAKRLLANQREPAA